jgi:hypothetical protein
VSIKQEQLNKLTDRLGTVAINASNDDASITHCVVFLFCGSVRVFPAAELNKPNATTLLGVGAENNSGKNNGLTEIAGRE